MNAMAATKGRAAWRVGPLVWAWALGCQATPPPTPMGQAVPMALSAAASAGPTSSREWQARNALYYKRNWGVDIVGVRPVSSGLMLAFRYRVLDPQKARLLNDRQSKAYLRDEASGSVFSVPAMENIGELRTGAAPEADRTYFMIFGNPGRIVKPGSRVSIVAGAMHIDGLIVDP